MSKSAQPDRPESELFDRIRGNEEKVAAFAEERDDNLGAFAGVLLALARGEEPSTADLEGMGVEVEEGRR